MVDQSVAGAMGAQARWLLHLKQQQLQDEDRIGAIRSQLKLEEVLYARVPKVPSIQDRHGVALVTSKAAQQSRTSPQSGRRSRSRKAVQARRLRSADAELLRVGTATNVANEHSY